MSKFIKETKKQKLPIGTKIIEKYDRKVYLYPSGKQFVEYKSKSNIFGKAYDWSQDGWYEKKK